MPPTSFNPNLPIELTAADAAQMRAQFNGLFHLIQTIPVGPTQGEMQAIANKVDELIAALRR